MGNLSRHILREGLKIPWREDPCLFRRKKKKKNGEGEGSLRRPREYGLPEKNFLLLEVHGNVEGGKGSYRMRRKKEGNDLFLVKAAQGEVPIFLERGGGWVGIGREFGRRQLTRSCID